MGMIPTALQRWLKAGYALVRITDRPTTDVSGWGLLYIDRVTRKLRLYDPSGGDRAIEGATGGGGGGGSGDVVGPSSATASQVVLFDGSTGKLVKAATTTGMLKATSGVLSAATAGTDYATPAAVTAASARLQNTLSLRGAL